MEEVGGLHNDMANDARGRMERSKMSECVKVCCHHQKEEEEYWNQLHKLHATTLSLDYFFFTSSGATEIRLQLDKVKLAITSNVKDTVIA